jgi:methyl-accepting chemotaxis protein/CHASE3 domain sensor protein
MSLKQRIMAGMVAGAVVTLITVVVATQALRAAVDAKDEVIERSARLVSDAHQLNAILNREASAVRGVLLTGDDLELGTVRAANESFDATLAGLLTLAEDPEVRAVADRIAPAKTAWDAVAEELIGRRLADGSTTEITRLVETRLFPAFRDVEAVVAELVELEEANQDEDSAAASRSADDAARLVWLLGGLAVLVSLAVGGWTARQASRRVSELARAIDASGAEVLSSTEQQAATSAELAAAVQQTVATVEELAQTANETAQRARTVADSAQRSSETAESGRQAIDASITGMDDVREQSDHVARSILSLAERARDISDIVAAVEDIADQTHLLALNASIEAARAGEHGRGFSVVASEVRALAEESRRATTQIADILGEIQEATNAAVMATEQGTRSVSTGSELVLSAGQTIEELGETISSATLAAEQISGSAGQQATATAQITAAMRDVRTAIDQSAAAARQSESAARELDRVARELKALVGASG